MFMHRRVSVINIDEHCVNASELCRMGDIVVAAIGKPRLVTAGISSKT